MIFIITSMLSEAKPFIRHRQMKRVPQESRYQIFKSGNAYLIITGVGATKAMMATTYLLTRFEAKKSDFVLSVGISACLSPSFEQKDIRGRIYLARSIYNAPFKRSCYPDLLYKTPFEEADLVTLAAVYRKTAGPCSPDGYCRPEITQDTGDSIPLLADMEASFVMEAAMDFVYTHHVFIFKIVSDDGNWETLSKQTVTELVSEHAGALSDFADNLDETEAPKPESSVLAFESLCSFGMYGSSSCSPAGGIANSPASNPCSSPANPETSQNGLLDTIGRNLRLTCYQQNELRQLTERYLLRGKPVEAITALMPASQVSTKRDGKEQYEQIRRLLMEP